MSKFKICFILFCLVCVVKSVYAKTTVRYSPRRQLSTFRNRYTSRIVPWVTTSLPRLITLPSTAAVPQDTEDATSTGKGGGYDRMVPWWRRHPQIQRRKVWLNNHKRMPARRKKLLAKYRKNKHKLKHRLTHVRKNGPYIRKTKPRELRRWRKHWISRLKERRKHLISRLKERDRLIRNRYVSQLGMIMILLVLLVVLVITIESV